MPFKQVLLRSVARDKILRGATQLADAVRVTLGPRSKSVLIQRKWGTPIVCNDGVTIAKEFELRDPEENLGAQVLRQAAEKTGDVVGDGTSTATLLAHAIFADGTRNVVAGASTTVEPERIPSQQAHARAEALAQVAECPRQPSRIAMRGAVQPEIADLIWDHIEPRERPRRQFKGWEIGQHEIVAEHLVAGDPFVVVQEVAAAIEDGPAPMDFDGLRMM
jgi:chaperonin GroEL